MVDVIGKCLNGALITFTVPVHDNSVWDVDTVQILRIMLGIGEQIQRVPGPVIWDL